MFSVLMFAAVAVASLCYGASIALFFARVVQDGRAASAVADWRHRSGFQMAVRLLGVGAVVHLGYITAMSFPLHECPIQSLRLSLSVGSALSVFAYLFARRRLRIEPLGLLVGPLALAFLLEAFFSGNEKGANHGSLFLGLHVLSNTLGLGLFLLSAGAATLYLVQERRLKAKRSPAKWRMQLPPLDSLDAAVHGFLVAGFPLLTVGVVTGTFWTTSRFVNSPGEVLRSAFGYATWLLIAGVLLLRIGAGWRGRRAAYGTLLGFAFAALVVAVYLLRPEPSALQGLGG